MNEGDLFMIGERIFRFDTFHYDAAGWAGAYVAECLNPQEGEGTWWCFRMDYEDDMYIPVAATIH